MKKFSILLIGFLCSIQNPLKIDFSKQENIESWKIINDGVMGGKSTGKVQLQNDYLNYYGHISFENNGGFSSFRSGYNIYNLSNFKEVEIEYSAIGGDFNLTLETAYKFYEPYFAIKLEDTNGKWKRSAFNLTMFSETVLGKKRGSYLTLDELKNVIRIGFLKNDKREGKFEFKLKYLKFS